MNVAFLDQYSVEKATHNKLLKRDSARVAFLVCVSFGVEVHADTWSLRASHLSKALCALVEMNMEITFRR
ncbi:hypothetical protein D048_0645, partial [Vibrio parahaemolyticus VPTS-2009]